MAGSRLEKLGTVFSRVRDLMRAGVMKPSQKPIWYDVYAAFPPKKEALYQEPNKKGSFVKVEDNVAPVFYEEDLIRAKFYERYGNGPKAFKLSQPHFKSTSQRFVEKFTELQKAGETDEEKLFEDTGKALLSEGIILRRKGIPPVWQPETGSKDPGFRINIKHILQETEEEPQQHLTSAEVQQKDPSPQ